MVIVGVEAGAALMPATPSVSPFSKSEARSLRSSLSAASSMATVEEVDACFFMLSDGSERRLLDSILSRSGLTGEVLAQLSIVYRIS